jgi:hypothetical protein
MAKKSIHRGRLQAQGPYTEKSVSWSRSDPPTKTEVLDMLRRLVAKLSARELEDRAECIEKVRRLIEQASADGIDAPVIKSFRNKKMRGGVRVDIEVQAGKACVDNPE